MKATQRILHSFKSTGPIFEGVNDRKRSTALLKENNTIGSNEVVSNQTHFFLLQAASGAHRLWSAHPIFAPKVHYIKTRVYPFGGRNGFLDQFKKDNDEIMEEEEPQEDIFGEFEEEEVYTSDSEQEKKDKNKDDDDDDDNFGGGLMRPVIEWIGGLFPRSAI